MNALLVSKMKLAVIVGFAVICLGGIFYIHHLQGETHEQANKLLTQGIAIKENEKTIVITTGNQVNAEKINKMVKEQEQQVEQDKKVLENKVITKLSNIQTVFKNKPATPQNTAEKYQEISTVYIDGLWESYCHISTTTNECVSNNR